MPQNANAAEARSQLSGDRSITTLSKNNLKGAFSATLCCAATQEQVR